MGAHHPLPKPLDTLNRCNSGRTDGQGRAGQGGQHLYFYSNDILFTASGRQFQTEHGKVPKSCREEIAAGVGAGGEGEVKQRWQTMSMRARTLRVRHTSHTEAL